MASLRRFNFQDHVPCAATNLQATKRRLGASYRSPWIEDCECDNMVFYLCSMGDFFRFEEASCGKGKGKSKQLELPHLFCYGMFRESLRVRLARLGVWSGYSVFTICSNTRLFFRSSAQRQDACLSVRL